MVSKKALQTPKDALKHWGQKWAEVVGHIEKFNHLYEKTKALDSLSDHRFEQALTLKRLEEWLRVNVIHPIISWARAALPGGTVNFSNLNALWEDFLSGIRTLFYILEGKSPRKLEEASLRDWYERVFLKPLDLLARALNDLLLEAGDTRFNYHGFLVVNPYRIGEKKARDLLRGLPKVVALFKRKGVLPILQKTLKRIIIRPVQSSEIYISGIYTSSDQTIQLLFPIKKEETGRITEDWFFEVFLHEVGHHIHLNLLHPEGRATWNLPWDRMEALQKKEDLAWETMRRVTYEDRLRYFEILKRSGWKASALRKNLKDPVDVVKAHNWLRHPPVGTPLVTPKNFQWTREFREYWLPKIENPTTYIQEQYGIGPKDPSFNKRVWDLRRQVQQRFGINEEDRFDHPILEEADLKKYRNFDPEIAQILESLEAPSQYAETNKKEDFAETFVAFLTDSSRLSPTARERMKRALSVSGLYGKQIMRVAKRQEERVMRGYQNRWNSSRGS